MWREKEKIKKRKRERGMELGGMNSGGKLKEKRKGGKEGEKKIHFSIILIKYNFIQYNYFFVKISTLY